MKTERHAPWLYISAAILVFILVIVVSVGITTQVDSSHVIISWDRLFHSQGENSIYLPALGSETQSDGISIEPNTGDHGLGIQDLGESTNP